MSREQRLAEFKGKVKDAVERKIGARVTEMVYLDILATSPQYQGKGYGGTLVNETSHLVRPWL